MSGALRGRVVVIAGATSPSGLAVARTLIRHGARVVGVGNIPNLLEQFRAAFPEALTLSCDLTSREEVTDMATTVRARLGPIDGLVHLVGGWRGAKGIVSQSDEDWDFFNSVMIGTLRNTTRAFYDDLVASDAGRLAIVSAVSVQSPTAASASYSAAKAATEAWALSVADGFRSDARIDVGGGESSATIFVVKALVDDAMRAAAPERRFPGHTDVDDLADAIAGLWTETGTMNGARIALYDDTAGKTGAQR
ncbi:SDR family NAD(P)-dependent oxidoreductase [Microbacterium sp. MYb64]|uniref:SDR family NAD(P)-dependent oxidoreductase n=1 Tax=Microbacterium sp. MYb64 TaxID=1848691 RepID=UPI000CFD171A|nr:SDR family NAD(P)-dependent oxidoreductase [Microbacterium sp. MYb64]PRB00956.1 oxidoreductase [Microbacterium sp. MYb64]